MNKSRKMSVRKQRLILISGIVLLGIICFFIYRKMNERTIDTSEGLKILRELEKKDVSEIDAKIQAMRPKKDKEGTDEDIDTGSIPEHFRGCVVMGDSIANELVEYQVLDESVVVADIGMMLRNAQEQMEKASQLNPGKVFLAYGLNDIEDPNGTGASFSQEYKEFLDEMRKMLPEAEFYITSITPANQEAIAKQPQYQKNEEYNDALKAMCEEDGNVTFIDTRDLITEDMYEADGIHFRPAYYESWAKRMIEVAEL
ncbi:GDSL-type esterase/lipase family protein [Sporofaciens sp. SGI.106]